MHARGRHPSSKLSCIDRLVAQHHVHVHDFARLDLGITSVLDGVRMSGYLVRPNTVYKNLKYLLENLKYLQATMSTFLPTRSPELSLASRTPFRLFGPTTCLLYHHLEHLHRDPSNKCPAHSN